MWKWVLNPSRIKVTKNYRRKSLTVFNMFMLNQKLKSGKNKQVGLLN